MRWIRFSILIITLIAVDQFVKRFIVTSGSYYTLNTGIALSILGDSKLLGIIANFVGILISICYVWINRQEISRDRVVSISFLMVLAGGISNFIDRFIYDAVVDYIRIFFIPTFNIADALVSIGLIMIIKQYLLKNEK